MHLQSRASQGALAAASTLMQCALVAASKPVNAPVSPTAPDIAVPIPSNFIGVGFEAAFLNDYARDFSVNLLNSLGKRTGIQPTIRIGGTSGDYFQFDQNQQKDKVCISKDCPTGSDAKFILGPSYFDGFEFFKNFYMTFQAPLSSALNMSNTLIYSTRAYEKIPKGCLAGIAVGNEPDRYCYNGLDPQPCSYSIEQYVQDSQAVMQSLSKAFGLKGQRIFEVLDISRPESPFTLTDAWEQNIDSSGNIKAAAYHLYQIKNDWTTIQQQQHHLMNHTAITMVFDPFINQIDYLKSNDPDVQFVLSETGPGLHGSKKIQGGFGAALWEIDMQLYSLTKGVARVAASQRPAAVHSYWVPNDSADSKSSGPEVRGVWYALPFLADFIGRQPGTVAEVSLGRELLTAYAKYDAATGLPSKIALINLRTWVHNYSGKRGFETVSIPIPSGTQYKVQYLRSKAGSLALGIDAGGPSESITWAGEQWSYSVNQGIGYGHPHPSADKTHTATDGKADIDVYDSEAILVTFFGEGR